MSQIVVIHEQEWKVADIEKEVEWCKSQAWAYTEYLLPDEHDHCTICYWTIFKTKDDESGFAYKSYSHWLCKECHDNLIVK